MMDPYEVLGISIDADNSIWATDLVPYFGCIWTVSFVGSFMHRIDISWR